jgi:hypothetical protein
MRIVLSYLVVILGFISCQKKQPVITDKVVKIEKESIGIVLDSWHKDAAEANFDLYFNAMTDKSIFIGTDASENWNKIDFKIFSKPYFDKGQAWSFTAVERNIYVYNNGKLAWFDELLDTWMGVCRGSGVLVKDEGSWEIEHYVLSLTIPNENIGDVKNINKEKDSLFLSRLKK